MEVGAAEELPKRKYTKKKKEAGKEEGGEGEVKPKRKYTKRKTVTKTVRRGSNAVVVFWRVAAFVLAF
jgi:hypothetical protein